MFKSAIEQPPEHWEPPYDEKYYNNLGLVCFIYKVHDQDATTFYKLWCPDVKNLMGSGNTLDEAKTDFWFHVMNRIYNREGGIYLMNSDITQCNQATTQQFKILRREYSKVELLDTTENIIILPRTLLGQ